MLDEASSYLTTFNTEVGRYRFTVMPFGIMVARDVFQQNLDKCFGHIENLIVIADDAMVIGKMTTIKTTICPSLYCCKQLEDATSS